MSSRRTSNRNDGGDRSGRSHLGDRQPASQNGGRRSARHAAQGSAFTSPRPEQFSKKPAGFVRDIIRRYIFSIRPDYFPCDGRVAKLAKGGAPSSISRHKEVALTTNTLIAIVDDDEDCTEAILDLIQSLGFAAEGFRSAQDFLLSPTVRKTSCLIADVQMPGMTGVELHKRLTERGYSIPTILVTAYPDDVVRARALRGGVMYYLTKPLDESTLCGCISSALGR